MELPDNVDLDYFDRQDLGRLRRTIRNAVQSYQRERELYLEIVLQYFKVRAADTHSLRSRLKWRSGHRLLPTRIGYLKNSVLSQGLGALNPKFPPI